VAPPILAPQVRSRNRKRVVRITVRGQRCPRLVLRFAVQQTYTATPGREGPGGCSQGERNQCRHEDEAYTGDCIELLSRDARALRPRPCTPRIPQVSSRRADEV
jgi:hypothetical protein